MQVQISNAITVTNPSQQLLNWCYANLIVANPEYTQRRKMGLWLKDTPKTLALFEVIYDTLILPYGVLKDILPYIQSALVTTDFKTHLVEYKGYVDLYDYQQLAVEKLIKAKFGILQSPTGSGKTQIGIGLITAIGRTALWITHTKDLLTQSYERALKYVDKSFLGVITEGQVNISKGITFATIQTLAKLDLNKYKYLWNVIIVDECQHVAGSPSQLTRYSRTLNALAAVYKYGLSATVHRADGMIKATQSLLGGVAHTIELKTIDIQVQPIISNTQISEYCCNTDGTLNWARFIQSLTEDEARNRIILRLLQREFPKSCLVLSHRVSHLKTLYDLLPTELRKHAVVVTGSTPKKVRHSAILAMQNQLCTIMLSTYSLCKEGIDIPCLENLIMATPQTDYAVVTQSIGRIARKTEDKTQGVCFDIVDNNRYCMKLYKQRLNVYRRNNYNVVLL